MRIHDNMPTSYHDELASWFPTWYSRVPEMDALWQTWGALLDQLLKDIQQVLDNFFVGSCDEETIEFWEEFMHISLTVQHSLEYRRRYIMTHFSGFGKCSASQIKSTVKQYTGIGAIVKFEECDADGNHQLVVMMENGEVEEDHLIELQTILEKIVPAHIPLTVRLPKQDGRITAHLSAAVTSLGGSMSATAVAPTRMDVSTTVYPMAAITKIQSSINVTAMNNS